MTRRFPNTVLIVAAIVALVVLGGVAGIVHTRSGDPGSTPPLAGTVAHFSLSNPRLLAPDAVVSDPDGKSLPLASFRSRVVLVNFWATWCIPCLKEMPTLDGLEKTLGGPDFTIAAVSIDRGGATTAAPWFEQNGIKNLTLYLDPESRAAFAFGANELPASVLIDRKGRVVGRMIGPAEWDAPEAQALIRAVMAEPS